MTGLLELQLLAATRPALDASIELSTAWYRAKARTLIELANENEQVGRDGSRMRALARAAHQHAEELALKAAALAIPAARAATDHEVI
ncbi:hypothetical protein [Amycolatopsis eburnea]|uniref:Uncharacterized protein n=1 Tax=Amycolatopsis eburnea TaxID=2267691 RepID=A0A3R9DSM1_9PSEU|nr:hypothetical protein [Amycolatopsis eburnea]RSD26443.1 hypothetical protein EIY87_00210 [Amycolatopsis eburnea]